MLKKKLFIILLIPTTLSSCKLKQEFSRKTSNEELIEIKEDAKVEEVKEDDINKIPQYVVSKMSSYKSYKSVTKGETIANTFFIKTNQSIDCTSIKGEYGYTKNESHSNIVNTVHEAYYHEDFAVYKDGEKGNYNKVSLEKYLSIYGTYPFENSIEGFIVTSGTIKSVTKEKDEGNLHFYKVIFDEEKAVNNVQIQMKKFGGLDEYPIFSLIELSLGISEDFTLFSIDLHSKYKAKKAVNTDCEQNYKVTFTNFNEDIEIPNLNNVKNLFDK